MNICQQNTHTLIINTLGALDIPQVEYIFYEIVFFVKMLKYFEKLGISAENSKDKLQNKKSMGCVENA